MSTFTLALALFVLIHIGVSATPLRAAIVGRVGEGPYRGLFALASAGLLTWMIFALGALRDDAADPLNAPLWTPPPWGHCAAQGLVLLGFLLLVTGLLTPGPTTAGMEGLLKKEEPARGVLRITRHPFLWGVALWAAGHLAANSERWAVMLFGALGVMALFGARSIDRKSAARDPEHWERFRQATSNIPFAAIVQGRNRFVIGELWWRIILALAAYAALAYYHALLFGAPAIP